MNFVVALREWEKRLREGEALASQGRVRPVEGLPAWLVQGGEAAYVVRAGAGCECPDSRFRREDLLGWCKHRFAVAVAYGVDLPFVAQLREWLAELQEAEKLVATNSLSPQEGRWHVFDPLGPVLVDAVLGCSCPTAQFRPLLRGWCRHRLAVELLQAQLVAQR